MQMVDAKKKLKNCTPIVETRFYSSNTNRYQRLANWIDTQLLVLNRVDLHEAYCTIMVHSFILNYFSRSSSIFGAICSGDVGEAKR